MIQPIDLLDGDKYCATQMWRFTFVSLAANYDKLEH